MKLELKQSITIYFRSSHAHYALPWMVITYSFWLLNQEYYYLARIISLLNCFVLFVAHITFSGFHVIFNSCRKLSLSESWEHLLNFWTIFAIFASITILVYT